MSEVLKAIRNNYLRIKYCQRKNKILNGQLNVVCNPLLRVLKN